MREPVCYGPDLAAAVGWALGFRSTRDLLGRLDPVAATRALARLRETFTAHLADDGVWLGSRAWIVSAER